MCDAIDLIFYVQNTNTMQFNVCIIFECGCGCVSKCVSVEDKYFGL